jgi:hypothetical protein
MSCEKKVKYATEKDALFDVERIKKKSTRKTVPIRAYECYICGSFHLTSRMDYKDIDIFKLNKEIERLKGELKLLESKDSEEIKEEQKGIRKEQVIVEMKKENSTLRKKNKQLRTDKSNLIHSNQMLRNKLKKYEQ